MIKAAYCSKELCQLLEKKGIKASHVRQFEKGGSWYNKYTLDVATRWLREKYDIDIIVFRHIRGKRVTFWGRVEHKTHLEHQDKCNAYITHENAVENGIKYCLENLI